MLARMMFAAVNFGARRGLTAEEEEPATGEARDEAGEFDSEGQAVTGGISTKKKKARQAGIRGETYAYWYLRRRGYVIVARNFRVAGMHGEIDLVGYDGNVLAFVEVKLRATAKKDRQQSGGQDLAQRREPLPEDAVTRSKRRHVARIAQHFLREWRIRNAPYRFDVLAIESQTGKAPVTRLHKDAFVGSAQGGW